jgi:anti-sigma regulatory factor (Ser/Thr protein kinase)
MVIGDVSGHNLQAAVVMGQLRNALRAYATEGHSPTAVVERVNRLLVVAEPEHMATCCYLEFDPRDGFATIVSAGHPPPLLVGTDGTAELLDVDANLPLGVDPEIGYAKATMLLDPGATLVLYTDSLVESPNLPLHHGLNRLVAAATAAPAVTVESLADRLLACDRGEHASDDVALLALQYRPKPAATRGEAQARHRLPADPTSPRRARGFVADILARWDGKELLDTATLLVTELVTNAVLHTDTDLEVGVRLGADRLYVEVVDQSDLRPSPRPADQASLHGRGLLIVEALADAWGVVAREGGKAVWFEMTRTIV